MTDLPESLAEAIHDTDMEAAEIQVLELVRKMQKVGRKDRSIVRALTRALITLTADLPEFYLQEARLRLLYTSEGRDGSLDQLLRNLNGGWSDESALH